MKKIIFIRTFYDTGAGGPLPPLGILYISSYLKKKFNDVDIKFADTYFYKEDDILHLIKEFNPNIVAFSSLSCEKDLLFSLAKKIRMMEKNLFFVAGGPYPSSNPEELMKSGLFDLIVLGEGEERFARIVESFFLKKNYYSLDGIGFVDNGNIKINPVISYMDNLDEIPFPDFSLIDIKKYSNIRTWNGANRQYPYIPIITSRGCPFGCAYCHNILGKKFRFRSVSNVVEEIVIAYDKYKVKEFHIIDDVFNYNINRAKDIARAIKRRFGKSLSFSFPNGIRADLVDEELISLLADIGTYKIYFGIESYSDRIRNELMKKSLSLDSVNRALELCEKHKIIKCGYFIFGFPGETENDRLETINYASKSMLDIAHFFKFTDYYGRSKNIDETTLFETDDYTLESDIRKAYLSFYFSFKRFINILFKTGIFSIKNFNNIIDFMFKLFVIKITDEVNKK
ncbi:MAG: B12-binding domain-containing radical SAM protein [Elusimicrobiales bacterium]|nr:B12-binding domain-containing radical SAM protein [Elusimicrobiales bacterium]